MNAIKTGFPPIAGKNARVLILGSMPGAESLRKRRYYANPHNAFWFIFDNLLKKGAEKAGYRGLLERLKASRIALWDVIRSCERKGSLDSAIAGDSVAVNDFPRLYARHRSIRRVYFNGAGAEKEYLKRVLPFLPAEFQGIKCSRLPSTSPAMARLSGAAKLAAWSVISRDP